MSQHTMKMSRFQLKITYHSMNQESLNENEREQSIDVDTKMAEVLELSQILKQL